MAVGLRRSLLTALAAIGLSVALVLGQATGAAVHSLVTLVNTVIGIGGGKDTTSERLLLKLNGAVVPPGYSYIGSPYPATLDMTNSVRVGMPALRENLDDTLAGSPGKILVVGYSEGALLAQQLKRDLARSTNPPSRLDLSFLEIATPFNPNGGIYARFPGLNIPGVIPGLAIPGMGPDQPTQYDTTFIINEYDPYGDFPAYFNPVALLNSLLGHEYAHVDRSYNPMDPYAEDNLVKEVPNGAGGTDTYILVPNPQLPLLGPLRDIAARLGVTPVSERFLGFIEPLLRVIVDMAYTDRLYLNPEVRKPFSLITPPHKVLEALNAVPGALREGVQNLLGRKRTPAVPEQEPDLAATGTQDRTAPVTLRSVPDPEPASEADLGAEDATEDSAEHPVTTVQKKKKFAAGPLEKALRGTIRTVFGDKSTTKKPTTEPTDTPDNSDSSGSGASEASEASGSDQGSRDGGAEAA
jgi:hypothetical protein